MSRVAALDHLAGPNADLEAAWKSGLAQYREGALAAAREIPAELLLELLGARSRASAPALIEALAADPWLDPSRASRPGPRPMIFVGELTGFGGLFLEPPRVEAQSEQFVVRCRQEAWALTADIFGATLHRTTAHPPSRAQSGPQLPRDLEVGGVNLARLGVDLSPLGRLTSAAATRSTVALTGEHTHAVALIPLAGGSR